MPYSSQGEGAPEYMKDIYEDGSESPEEKESKENERLREFQQKAMELLELYDMAERIGDSLVVDLEEIRNFSSQLFYGRKREWERGYWLSRKTTKRGYACVDGVNYYLGSEYAGGNHEVISLGKNTFGVSSLSESGKPEQLELLVDKITDSTDLPGGGRASKKELEERNSFHNVSDDSEWSDINMSEFLKIKEDAIENLEVYLEDLPKDELLSFLKFYKEQKRDNPGSLGDIQDFLISESEEEIENFSFLKNSDLTKDEFLSIAKKVKKRTKEYFDIKVGKHLKKRAGYTEEEISEKKEPDSDKKKKLKKIKETFKELGNNYFDYFEGKARHFLLSAFKGKKVLTRKEFEEEEKEGKPLFYHPEDEEEAFNKESIKNSDFHIGPWEINAGGSLKEYSPLVEDLDYTEASLAAIIYNKNYGDGERRNGQLLVRDVDYDTGEFSDRRRKIALDWILKGNRPYGMDLVETGFKLSPRKSLEEGNYPNLQENNLLKPEDFQIMPGGETAEKYGLYKIVTNSDGYVTLDNHIRYGLGGDFGGGDSAVTRLGKNTYGIVKLDENNEPVELEATLDEVDPNKIDLREDAGDIKKTGFRQLKKLNYIHEISEDDGWSEIEISDILEIKKKVAKNTDISLENLSEKELLSFIQFYKNKKENEPEALEKVHDFVKTYGVYGLRSFAALEHSGFDGGDIIKIMDIPETRGDATPIFRKYSEIMEKVDNLEEEVRLFFKQRGEQGIDTEEVSAEIINRASKILTQGLEAENRSYREIEKDLEELNEEVITFTSIFKTAFKGEEEVDFEAVKGLSFESKSITELDEEEKEQMKSISEKNWKPRKGGENVDKKFKKTLEDNNEGNFYILKKDGEVIAYINIKESPQKDHKKATSLNVDPDYRGSAIGWSMLKSTLDNEAEDYIIDATVLPELKVGTTYVNDFGFNIVGTEKIGSKEVFTIQIDKDKNENTQTRSEDFDLEKLESEYKQKFAKKKLQNILNQDRPPNYFIRSYNVVENQQKVLKEVDQATNEGYEITRYFEDETVEEQDEEIGSPKRYFVFEKIEE